MVKLMGRSDRGGCSAAQRMGLDSFPGGKVKSKYILRTSGNTNPGKEINQERKKDKAINNRKWKN